VSGYLILTRKKGAKLCKKTPRRPHYALLTGLPLLLIGGGIHWTKTSAGNGVILLRRKHLSCAHVREISFYVQKAIFFYGGLFAIYIIFTATHSHNATTNIYDAE
jgi:hypothetical protein